MPDQTIHLIARLVPKPGSEAALAEAVAAIVPDVQAEAGCIAYVAHESLSAPGTIVFIEAWADQAALDAHSTGPALATLAARLGELLAEKPALERLRRL